jgi:PAS domain S-box-containing protein
MVTGPAQVLDTLHILHLEDSALDAELVETALRDAGLEPRTVRVTTAEGFERGLAVCPDLIIADYSLPQFDGGRALRIARERCPEIPFIVVSGALGEELAIELMKAGASDYVLKDRLGRLGPAVRRALDTSRARAEHRRATLELRRSEEFLRRVIESTSDCVEVMDLDTRTVSINPSGVRMTGMSGPEEAIGRPWLEWWTGDDRAAAEGAVARALEGGTGRFVGYCPSRAGAPMWWDVAITAIPGDDGRPERLLAVSRNDTDRVRYQADLARKAEELARSNADLEDFAYIASHDLKEPLRGIANFATFVLEDHGGELSSEASEKVRTVAKLAKRMHTLLDSLLEFSRVGRTELAIAPHDLGPIVEGVLEELRERIGSENVEVIVHGPLPRVRCDAVRLGVVLSNLVSNAIKYNTSAPKRVEIGCAGGDPAEVYVRDNGIGIPHRHFAKIFKMFERLHPHDRYGGGTGSGLAISQKIISRHGGSLRVESEPGAGSTFFFTLEPSGPRTDENLFLHAATPAPTPAAKLGEGRSCVIRALANP